MSFSISLVFNKKINHIILHVKRGNFLLLLGLVQFFFDILTLKKKFREKMKLVVINL